jgi:hypothetical protein
MARQSVTTHKRSMRNGTTVTVHQHRRTGPDPSRAWRSVKRGWKHQRNGNPGRAAMWCGLAVVEVGGYVLFKTVGVALVTFACIAGGCGMTLLASSGKPKP